MLELLITIAILGILVSVALPSFTEMLGRSNVNSATRTLGSAISLARSEAIKRGQDVGICGSLNGAICANNAWNTGWVVVVDINNDGDYVDTGELIRVYTPLSDMTLTASSNLLEYDSRGFGANAAVVTFDICPEDGKIDNGRRLQVGISGRARMIEGLDCS